MKRDSIRDDHRRRFLAGAACLTTATFASGLPSHARAEPVPGDPWGQSKFCGRIQLDVATPRRIALDPNGELFLAVGNQVIRLDRQGGILELHSFERPVRCLAVDEQTIFVGIRDSVHLVQRREPRTKHVFPVVRHGHLVGDLVRSDGDLLVSDVTSGQIIRCPIESIGRNEAQRWSEQAVRRAISTAGRITDAFDGAVAVTDPARHRIAVTNRSGAIATTWGHRSRRSDGFQGCCNPMVVSRLPDGSWISAEAGQVRIKRFDAQGKFISQIAGPDDVGELAVANNTDPRLGCGAGGLDMATSRDGQLWILHAAAKQLIHFQLGRA